MARPRPEKKSKPAAPAGRGALPTELQVGEWEVIAPPYSTAGGRVVHARVQRMNEPASWEIRSWESSYSALPRLPPSFDSDVAASTTSLDRRSRSLAMQFHVLVGRGVGVASDQTETGLRDARADAVQEGELPDWREHRLFVHELLNPL